MLKTFRYFSIVTLISFCAAGITLVWFYRTITVHELVELGEQSNVVPAQTALNAIRSELVTYLGISNKRKQGSVSQNNIPEILDTHFRQLISGTKVDRIKIYDVQGVVIFSTKPNQVDQNQAENPGFISAMNGKVLSKLIYRDTFNAFDEETEDDNLIQTYLPVRQGPTKPIVGVFEMYTDVNSLVARAENLQLIVAGGVAIALSLLYGVLLYIASRAKTIIQAQQAVIRDRSESLELLSAQLMNAQEAERKRIAEQLHEGIAQSLSAVRISIEDLCTTASNIGVAAIDTKTKRLLTVIQGAIGEVRQTAMDLRPSSLDDIGVVATTEWFCREYKSVYPGINIYTALQVQEGDVSRALKVIIFRLVQETLHYLVIDVDTDDIRIELEKSNDSIVLTMQGSCIAVPTNVPLQISDNPVGRSTLTALNERVNMSGGTFTANCNIPNQMSFRMAWSI